jgi:hypothetical protein
MKFLKDLGVLAGTVTGGVIGGAVSLAGKAVKSDFIEEIGEVIYNATLASGKILGEAASGAADVVTGMVTSDESKRDEGFRDLGSAVGTTAKGVGKGIANIIQNGGDVIDGALEGDKNRVNEAAKSLVKTAAIATLAIGVIDIVDGGLFDGQVYESDVASSGDFDYNNSNELVYTSDLDAQSEDVGVHHVEPHYVDGYERSDGTHVEGYYRDGDGNPETTLTEEDGGGYIRSNPDGISSNNINSNI